MHVIKRTIHLFFFFGNLHQENIFFSSGMGSVEKQHSAGLDGSNIELGGTGSHHSRGGSGTSLSPLIL